MNFTFFHCTSSRSASSARRSISESCGAQRPVDDQIRIPPDRGGEVRIARRRQTEVTQVLRRVSRLLHRAQHQERNGLLFRFAVDALDQLLKMPGPQGVRGRREAVAESGNELL